MTVATKWDSADGGARARLVIHALLACLTLAVFAPVCSYDFVNYDDEEYVTGNAHVQRPFSAGSVRWAFTTGYFNNWHPLTWLSHMLDYCVFGLRPGGHHAINLLLHTLNAMLLFEVLRRMTGCLWQSAVVAALFAIHPLHVEPVAWISGRKDVLSTCCVLLALLAYDAYVKRPGLGRYLMIVSAFTLGIMAKSMAVTLPCLLLILDYWPLRRFESDSRRAAWLILEKVPLFALALTASIVALCLKTVQTASPGSRLINTLTAYGWYVVKMVCPIRLAVIYPYPASGPPWWQPICAGVLLVTFTVCAIVWVRKRPYFAAGWVWYVIALAPASGIIQIGWHPVADRYAYLSLTGLFIILVWGGAELASAWHIPWRATAGMTLAVLAGFAAAASVQRSYWRDSITLFTHAVAVTKDNPIAYNNLGMALLERRGPAEAEPYLRKTVELAPSFAKGQANLGRVLENLGHIEEARAAYAEAARQDRRNGNRWADLGAVLMQLQRYPEAEQAFGQAASLHPSDAAALYNLGLAIERQGRFQDAADCYRKALEAAPGFRPAQERMEGLSRNRPPGS